MATFPVAIYVCFCRAKGVRSTPAGGTIRVDQLGDLTPFVVPSAWRSQRCLSVESGDSGGGEAGGGEPLVLARVHARDAHGPYAFPLPAERQGTANRNAVVSCHQPGH